MRFSNYNHPHDEFHFNGKIPAELTRYQMPGSTIEAISNGYGQFIIQQVDAQAGKVIYSAYRIERKSVFNLRDTGPYCCLSIALQHDRRVDIEGLGPVHLKEGQFNFLYSPHYNLTSAHDAGKEYVTLELWYDNAALEEWTPYFPSVVKLLTKVKAGEPAILLEEHGWLTREIQDSIYRLLHSSDDMPSYPVYTSMLVKAVLFHLLLQSVQKQPRSSFTHYEIDGIHEARDIICRNIRYHYPIREIAQRVGLNEFKLKNGFRSVYGDGLYEYLLAVRMLEARNLLADPSKNVKEIAALTGYKSVNSFIKAFKRKYHQTPGEFRSRELEYKKKAKAPGEKGSDPEEKGPPTDEKKTE